MQSTPLAPIALRSWGIELCVRVWWGVGGWGMRTYMCTHKGTSREAHTSYLTPCTQSHTHIHAHGTPHTHTVSHTHKCGCATCLYLELVLGADTGLGIWAAATDGWLLGWGRDFMTTVGLQLVRHQLVCTALHNPHSAATSVQSRYDFQAPRTGGRAGLAQTANATVPSAMSQHMLS